MLIVAAWLWAVVPAHAQHNSESDFLVTRTADLGGVIIIRFVGDGTVVSIPPRIRGLPVVEIGENAFQGQNEYGGLGGIGLTAVTIPDTVVYIGDWAFSDNQLTTVAIPNSVATIGQFAFASNQLTAVSIPNSVTTIGAAAFWMNQLTSVSIPDSVTVIESAFSMNQLTSVSIPNSVTTIRNGAFYGNQLASVIIPSSVTAIERDAFTDNPLTSVTIGANVFIAAALGVQAAGLPSGFIEAYNRSSRRAGTYMLHGDIWLEEW